MTGCHPNGQLATCGCFATDVRGTMLGVVSVWPTVALLSLFFSGLVCLFGVVAEAPLPLLFFLVCCSLSLVVIPGLLLAHLY